MMMTTMTTIVAAAEPMRKKLLMVLFVDGTSERFGERPWQIVGWLAGLDWRANRQRTWRPCCVIEATETAAIVAFAVSMWTTKTTRTTTNSMVAYSD